MNATSQSPSDPNSDRAPAPPAHRVAPPSPSPRRLFAIAVFAALLGLAITLSFGYADHDPKPHEVRVAVAAATAVRAKVAAGLAHAEPGGFDLVSVSSPRAATQSVRSQTSAGALIVPPIGAVTIVTAGAEGVLQQQALTAALTAASQSMHRLTKPLDVAPLPTGDRAGLSSFVFGLGLLLPSVIGGIGVFLLGMRLRLWWRVAAATLFALLAACGGVLAMDTVLGALTGAGGALIGIGFLGALSFVLFVAALQAVVGLPGTALAAVAFIFVGNAVSGGSVPIGFLPAGFRQIAPWLPNNAIVRGARDVVYFNGHDLAHPLLVLGLWPAVALSVIAAVDLLHLSERRQRPHNTHEIYGTSAAVHVSRRLRTRRLRTEETPAMPPHDEAPS
ncbi:MAG: ABC transporter permease [Solirubrobacteraceae bacterium]